MPVHRCLWSAGRALGMALAVLLIGAIGAPLQAQPSGSWIVEGRDELLRAAAMDALKKTMPGADFAFNVTDWGVDPLVTAATTPGTTEQKIDAWVHALGAAGVSAAMPAHGYVLAGGKIIVGGSIYTVESMIAAAHDQQVYAILEGRGAGGLLDRINNVMADTPFVSVLPPGVTLDNIGYRSRAELETWWGRYVSQVRDLYGRGNVDVVNNEVWPKLLAMWETQRVKSHLERAVGQFDEAMVVAQAQANAQAQATGLFTGDLSGTWRWTCCGGAYTGTFTLTQKGELLSGRFVEDGSTFTGAVGVTVTLYRSTSIGTQAFWLTPSNGGNHLSGQIAGARDMSIGNDFQATRISADSAASATGAAAPTSGTGIYVFILKDIGLVAATPDEVRTRPRCQWAGGGPPPCTEPAIAEGTLGGPYPSVAAARADMKTKLDCHNGYWGTFLPLGAGRAWLQNNITGADCRSMKQL